MTTKVKVPRGVAKAIEHLRTITYSNHELLRVIESTAVNPVARRVYDWAFATNGGGSPDLLMQALVNGYEVEKTPEEKILGYYERNQDALERAIRLGWADTEYMAKGTAHGVKTTLDLLGIKIEGVNA